MDGAYLQSSSIQPLIINQPVGFTVRDDNHALQLKDELASWLVTDESVELQFDDEPGRIYYAVVQNSIDDFEKFAELRNGTIQFLCLDPYSYGTELTPTFPSDAVTLTNEGTAEAYPVFELEVLAPITFAQIANPDGDYMMIGRQQTIDDIVVDSSPTVLSDDMGDVSSWTSTGVIAPDGGAISGNFASDGDVFLVSGYGTDPGDGWYGPALRKNLPSPIQDFRAEVRFTLEALSAEEIGRCELYLIGADGTKVGKLAMKEILVSDNDAVGEARIGGLNDGHMLAKGNGYQKGSYNGAYSRLWVRREGQKIKAQIGEIVDGEFANRINGEFNDVNGLYQTELSAIEVHIGKMSGYKACGRTYIHTVTVEELKDVAVNEAPKIADVGDKITLDHQTDNILINGESRTDLKNFGASYFGLMPGKNSLFVFPEQAFDVTAKWRTPYK